MKRTTALFIFIAAMFILSPMTIFAADAKTPPDMPQVPIPKSMEVQSPDMNAAAPAVSTVPLTKMPDVAFPGIPGSGTVVATSDGGIVIVTGSKVSKFDKNLKITKTIELSND